MNFLRPLAGFALCTALGAQALDMKPQGGGELKIGDTPFRFEITSLSSAPAKGGLSGAVRLEGNLIALDASPGFQINLTVLKNGSLYMLHIHRKTSGPYPDSWAATQKTRTHALVMEDRAGGRVEIRCEGRLTGIIAKQPRDATWSGTIWGIFPGETADALTRKGPGGQMD